MRQLKDNPLVITVQSMQLIYKTDSKKTRIKVLTTRNHIKRSCNLCFNKLTKTSKEGTVKDSGLSQDHGLFKNVSIGTQTALIY